MDGHDTCRLGSAFTHLCLLESKSFRREGPRSISEISPFQTPAGEEDWFEAIKN
jgi:hypothetical protein